jgi:hypothetical protein
LNQYKEIIYFFIYYKNDDDFAKQSLEFCASQRLARKTDKTIPYWDASPLCGQAPGPKGHGVVLSDPSLYACGLRPLAPGPLGHGYKKAEIDFNIKN